MFSEADHIGTLEGPLLHLHQQPTSEREATDDGPMVPGQRGPQQRGHALGRIGSHQSRQQVKAGFVYKDDGSSFGLRVFSERASVRSARPG